MRYATGHKESMRERIIAAASVALRQHGIDGISIPSLMRKVGLTHGGFYAHFPHRDALVAAAIRSAGAQTGHAVLAPAATMSALSQRYLSPQHVANPEHGCVLAALGCDGVRQSPEIKAAFAEVAQGFLRLLEAKHSSRSNLLSDQTLAQGATLVGAVILARLVDDPGLATRILAAAQQQVAS